MRKRFLVIGMATLTVLAFTGCGKKDNEQQTTSAVETTTQEQTTTQQETTAEETTTELTNEADAETGKQTADLNGALEDILAAVYANAELDPDLRQAMEFYETSPINADNEEYLLGTTELEYEEAVCSAPMMSSVAYQCVLVRLPEGADAEAAKQLLVDSADPRKWVCVEAEATKAESIGNLVLMIMADQETVDAVTASFLGLAE